MAGKDPLASLFDGEDPDKDDAGAEGTDGNAQVDDPDDGDGDGGDGVKGAEDGVGAKQEKEEDDEELELPDDDSQTVPVGAIRKEREKWKKRMAEVESRARETDIRLDERRKAQPEPKTAENEPLPEFELPDPVENPKEYAAAVAEVARIQALNDNLNRSERKAIKLNGKEKVDVAFDWLQKQPAEVRTSIMNDVDPYGELMDAHKAALKAEAKSSVPDEEYEQFKKWKAAQKGKKSDDGEGAKSGKKASKQPDDDDETPPPSLAGTPSARGKDSKEVGTGPGEAFNSIFPG